MTDSSTNKVLKKWLWKDSQLGVKYKHDEHIYGFIMVTNINTDQGKVKERFYNSPSKYAFQLVFNAIINGLWKQMSN